MWQASSSFVAKTIPPSAAAAAAAVARPRSFPAPSARRNANSTASISTEDVAGAAPRFPALLQTPKSDAISARQYRSLAIGSVISLAIVYIPAMSAFRRLATSMNDLSKVASEEVPGTLTSLKLSGLEINELTQQLSNLRQKISGSNGKRERGGKPSSSRRRNYPFV